MLSISHVLLRVFLIKIQVFSAVLGVGKGRVRGACGPVDDRNPTPMTSYFCNSAYIPTVGFSFFLSFFAIDKKEVGNKNIIIISCRVMADEPGNQHDLLGHCFGQWGVLRFNRSSGSSTFPLGVVAARWEEEASVARRELWSPGREAGPGSATGAV